MATFRKRNGKWNVQIRKKSAQGSISGTFDTKSEARLWAATIEAGLEHGQSPFIGHHPTSKPNGVLLKELFAKYREEVLPKHKGWKSELATLKVVDRRLGNIRPRRPQRNGLGAL